MWSVIIIGRQEYRLQRQGTVLLRNSSPVLYPSYILSSMHFIMLNFKPDVQLKEYSDITYFLFYSWRIILMVTLLKVVSFSWDDLIWKDRLQNSPYFCVFIKYARAVQKKVWNEAENRERDWGETLKIWTVCFAYVIFVRFTRFSQPRAIPIG